MDKNVIPMVTVYDPWGEEHVVSHLNAFDLLNHVAGWTTKRLESYPEKPAPVEETNVAVQTPKPYKSVARVVVAEEPKEPEVKEEPKEPEVKEEPKEPEVKEEPKEPEVKEEPKEPKVKEEPAVKMINEEGDFLDKMSYDELVDYAKSTFNIAVDKRKKKSSLVEDLRLMRINTGMV